MAFAAALRNAVRTTMRQKTAGCSPRSWAVLSIIATSAGVKDRVSREVRFSGGGRASTLRGRLGRGGSRRGGIGGSYGFRIGAKLPRGGAGPSGLRPGTPLGGRGQPSRPGRRPAPQGCALTAGHERRSGGRKAGRTGPR